MPVSVQALFGRGVEAGTYTTTEVTLSHEKTARFSVLFPAGRASQWRAIHKSSGSTDPDRVMAEGVQPGAATQLLGVPAAGTGGGDAEAFGSGILPLDVVQHLGAGQERPLVLR